MVNSLDNSFNDDFKNIKFNKVIRFVLKSKVLVFWIIKVGVIFDSLLNRLAKIIWPNLPKKKVQICWHVINVFQFIFISNKSFYKNLGVSFVLKEEKLIFIPLIASENVDYGLYVAYYIFIAKIKFKNSLFIFVFTCRILT